MPKETKTRVSKGMDMFTHKRTWLLGLVIPVLTGADISVHQMWAVGAVTIAALICFTVDGLFEK